MHLRPAHLAEPALFDFIGATLIGTTLGGADLEEFKENQQHLRRED